MNFSYTFVDMTHPAMDYVTGVLLMVMSGMAVLLNFAILWIVLRSLKDRKEGESYFIILR